MGGKKGKGLPKYKEEWSGDRSSGSLVDICQRYKHIKVACFNQILQYSYVGGGGRQGSGGVKELSPKPLQQEINRPNTGGKTTRNNNISNDLETQR